MPSASGATESYFIGVIDASGSMSSWWHRVAKFYNEFAPKQRCHTICFTDKTQIVPNNTLSPKIFDHGGGLTNIPKAFLKMEQKIASLPQNAHVTVLFISDGQDNYLDTL